ncbi:unnamed protein product [Rotaria socialis]|uniref:SCP domain-containing protein n=1 Tax=Rotaria socialis TaxID=392032 RepID=A0A818X3A4_9BILA|nr:unnamed protein product [Rotaria socialis]CAF3607693.1 unnamed protein product [Rotaria socialis]CAF3732006.1 unnamed protein product [Rotaria socialis]CAF4276474.1 unnamed protein product [Rotaria socialis]
MSASLSAFYAACCINDLKTVQATANRNEVDASGPDGNTPLHAASKNGHVEVVRLLLRYHASRTAVNHEELTAEELACNEETKAVFKDSAQMISDSNHFVASSREVEWVDSYKNAYRISYENHEHMKRWLTKVTLSKLLNAIITDYIDKLNFAFEKTRETIKEYVSYTIDLDDPLGLLLAYTHPCGDFFLLLNRNLAEFGSDFRFSSTQALLDSGYADNEPPKGLGQYIFASIVINHPRFRPYQYAGTTYRGMKITKEDLEEYNNNNIIMTRSFLSTSKKRSTAELFLHFQDDMTHPTVICIYKVINQRSSLAIENINTSRDNEGADHDSYPLRNNGRGSHEANSQNYAAETNGTHGIPMDEFEQIILDQHNKYRRQMCANDLEEDDNLHEKAHKRAHTLANGQDIQLSDDFSENVYILDTADPSKITGEIIVKAWYDEYHQYNVKNESSAIHFSQLVWKNSKKLGVGHAYTGHTLYIVAFYKPPGNIRGQFDINVGCNSSNEQNPTKR